MFTFPRMNPIWRTAPTCHPMGNGCCWWRWTSTTCGSLAVWFPRTAVLRAARWVRSGEAARSAAWSPDGKWMYFTSNAGGANHIWRQRFPDGQPEQITSGPTEEEGIAMAPDGRSFVTAVALQNTSLWVHDAKGERQISLEGNAAYPKFTPDGKKLCYRVVKEDPTNSHSTGSRRSEGGRPEIGPFRALGARLSVLNYDISADGRQVVMEAPDRDGSRGSGWRRSIAVHRRGRSRMWRAGNRIRAGRRNLLPPTEGTSTVLFTVFSSDGTGLRKALESLCSS